MFDDEQTDQVNQDQYFCIIPEWVLYAEVSATAVRVYGVLNRYANDKTNKCHPARSTIAEKCRISEKSVDRAIKELKKIKALKVKSRKSSQGDYTSNEYTLFSISPAYAQWTPVSPGGDKNDTTGGDTGVQQTKASINQSQEPSSVPTKVETAKSIASEWWDALDSKPLGSRAWWSINKVVEAALKRDHSREEILKALSKCKTVPTITWLDLELQNAHKQHERFKTKREIDDQRTKEAFLIIQQNTQKELNP